MELLDFDATPDHRLAASAVTVGNFDGVHFGHRAIIEKVIEAARKHGAPSVVVTFDPHPREVIYKGQSVPAIIPFSERVRLIGEMGVDYLAKVNFTCEFAGQSAEEFIGKTVAKFHPKAMVIGHDFRFGRGRAGGYEMLMEAGTREGFAVFAVEAVEIDGSPVSSTRIRGLIQAGEMRRARRLLGAPFSVIGDVVHGHGRGRNLGFATANIKWENKLVPPDGVYAARALFDNERYPAVVNIGDNPTFGDSGVTIEAHVMGFNGDIYGRPIRIEFFRRLRGEIKFNSPAALVEQIKHDVARARETLIAETGEDLFAKAGMGSGL